MWRSRLFLCLVVCSVIWVIGAAFYEIEIAAVSEFYFPTGRSALWRLLRIGPLVEIFLPPIGVFLIGIPLRWWRPSN
jgi:hypothetical protein